MYLFLGNVCTKALSFAWSSHLEEHLSELAGKRLKENRNIRTGWQVVGEKNEVSELVSKRLGRTRKEKKRKKIAGQPFDGTDGKFNKSISLFLFFYIFFNYLLIDDLCKFIYSGCISVLCLFIIYLALI